MLKLSSFLVCILAVVPVVVLCKPSPQVAGQPHPQVQPPVASGGPSVYPAILPVVDPKESSTTPRSIGIHLEEVVAIHPDGNSGPPAQSKLRAAGACPKILLPVCGSDNKTYNSACELGVAQKSDTTLTQIKDEAC